jgi:mono/diheme cytochrome c family protein
MWRSVAGPAAAAAVLLLSGCGGDAGAPTPVTAPVRDAARGQSVFDLRCAPCHGTGGGGDGPAAVAITPKPRNFRDVDFWKGRTGQQLRLVVRQGKPGTLMPPFEGVLSEAEIDDVVAYMEHFRPTGS